MSTLNIQKGYGVDANEDALKKSSERGIYHYLSHDELPFNDEYFA